MMDQFRQLAIFAKTVDHGSFRGAALALNLSPSVVSHHVSQLEAHLGVALLYRSTRKLALTKDGERLLGAAHRMVEAAEDGLHSVVETARIPSGELRVTLPAILAQSQLVDRIAAFSRSHPNVHLTLDFTDARRDLIGDGFDIAFRMGWLKDSTLISRKLYDVPRILVSSTQYLSAYPAPQTPEDLNTLDWILLAQVERQRATFRHPRKPSYTVKPEPRLLVNDAHALYHLARAGAGLALIPEFLALKDIAEGRVQNVLPDWTADPVGVYAVRPANAPKHGLSRLFIDAMSEH